MGGGDKKIQQDMQILNFWKKYSEVTGNPL